MPQLSGGKHLAVRLQSEPQSQRRLWPMLVSGSFKFPTFNSSRRLVRAPSARDGGNRHATGWVSRRLRLGHSLLALSWSFTFRRADRRRQDRASSRLQRATEPTGYTYATGWDAHRLPGPQSARCPPLPGPQCGRGYRGHSRLPVLSVNTYMGGGMCVSVSVSVSISVAST
jgi:hypothetical protein